MASSSPAAAIKEPIPATAYVVIVHNTVSQGDGESEMDTIHAVELVSAVLDELKLQHTTIAVRNPSEFTEKLTPFIAGQTPAGKVPVVFNLYEPPMRDYVPGKWDNELLPDSCEKLGIPVCGGSTFGLQFTLDKFKAKQAMREAGVPVSRAILAVPGETDKAKYMEMAKAELGDTCKVIVKPCCSGASEGIEFDKSVHGAEKALGWVDGAWGRVEALWSNPAMKRMPVLTEEFVGNGELQIMMFEPTPGHPEVLTMEQLDFSKLSAINRPPIVDYAAKWSTDSDQYKSLEWNVPAPITPESWEMVSQFAVKAFTATHCRDFARIDMRCNLATVPESPLLLKVERVWALEANLNPGISGAQWTMDHSHKMDFNHFVAHMINNALLRANKPLPSSSSSSK